MLWALCAVLTCLQCQLHHTNITGSTRANYNAIEVDTTVQSITTAAINKSKKMSVKRADLVGGDYRVGRPGEEECEDHEECPEARLVVLLLRRGLQAKVELVAKILKEE